MISDERREELIEQETAATQHVLDKYAKDMTYLSIDTREFVAKCFENKRALIEEMDGWRWHGNVELEDMGLSVDEVLSTWWNVLDKHRAVKDIKIKLNDQRLSYERQFTHLITKNAKEAFELELMDYSRFVYDTTRPDRCTCANCVQDRVGRGQSGMPDANPNNGEIKISVRKGQSIARAVLGGLEKEGVDDASMACWREFFERLGQMYATGGEKWGVTFSAAPSSFLRLGHYNEGGSCYAFGHERHESKGVLAQMSRSVVTLFYAKPDGELPQNGEPRKGKVSGRLWGQMGNAQQPGMLMSNLYCVTWQRAEAAARKAAAMMQGLDDKEWKVLSCYDFNDSDSPAIGCRDDVYVNDAARIISNDGYAFEKWLKKTSVKVSADVCSGKARCAGCGENADNTYLCDDCGNERCSDCMAYNEHADCYYCSDCGHNVQCSYSRCYAYGSNHSFIELADGRFACPDHAFECITCNEYHLTSAQEECEGCNEPVCSDCIIAHDVCGDQFCSQDCIDEHIKDDQCTSENVVIVTLKSPYASELNSHA